MKQQEIRTIVRNFVIKPNSYSKSKLVREIQRRDSRKLKAVWLRQARI